MIRNTRNIILTLSVLIAAICAHSTGEAHGNQQHPELMIFDKVYPGITIVVKRGSIDNRLGREEEWCTLGWILGTVADATPQYALTAGHCYTPGFETVYAFNTYSEEVPIGHWVERYLDPYIDVGVIKLTVPVSQIDVSPDLVHTNNPMGALTNKQIAELTKDDTTKAAGSITHDIVAGEVDHNGHDPLRYNWVDCTPAFEGEFAHRGDSGAPVWVNIGDRAAVIGILVAGNESDGSMQNFIIYKFLQEHRYSIISERY